MIWLSYNLWLLVAKTALSEASAVDFSRGSSSRDAVIKRSDVTTSKSDVLLEFGRSYTLEQIATLQKAASNQATNKVGNMNMIVSRDSDLVVESSTAKDQIQATLPLVGSTHNFDDEKVIIDKSLRVRYTYTCPTSGRQQREFEMKTFYSTFSGDLRLHDVLNINAFDPGLAWTSPIGTFPHTFSFGMRGHFCQAFGQSICTYNFYGHIEGTLADVITLSIVSAASQMALVPKVWENCLHLSTVGHAVCPAVIGTQCRLNSVEALPT